MTINARRFAYDKDGTMVGYSPGSNWGGVSEWLSQTQLASINLIMPNSSFLSGNTYEIYVVFPELRNIVSMIASAYYTVSWLQYSTDTTDGFNGTWVDATLPSGKIGLATGLVSPARGLFAQPYSVAIGVPVKGLRFKNAMYLFCLAIYGSKATPDDLRFTDVAGTEFTALQDLGNKTAGSATVSTVYVKNGNATYGASDVTVKVEGTRYTTSLDNITFDATDKVIGALASGAISAPIYVKFAPVEGDALGFNAGRILVNGTLNV